MLVCRWMDNAVVTIASTVHGWSMSGKANRYLNIKKKRILLLLLLLPFPFNQGIIQPQRIIFLQRREKKRIELNYSEMIKHYNMHIRNIDLQDQNVNKYRIGFRGKKWWWRNFT